MTKPSPVTHRNAHQLTALHVPAAAGAWKAAGFAGFTGDEGIRLGSTTLVPSVDVTELVVSIDGIDDLDGLTLGTQSTQQALVAPEPAAHPNTAIAIDHLVVMSPDCDRTTASFERAGLEARRVRRIDSSSGTRRQTFFWMGDVVCEMVGPDVASGDGPASVWGLAVTVRDLAAARELLGDHASDIKDAVQPGRQVCTVRKDAELGVPMLLISPHIEGTSSRSSDG